MKKSLIVILSLLILLLGTNCHISITANFDNPQLNEPILPEYDDYHIDLSIFTTLNMSYSEKYHNWFTAVMAMKTWTERQPYIDSLLKILYLCSFSEPQHFGGNTWYWEITDDSLQITLYATLLSSVHIYYEGYVSQKDGIKFMDGNYYPQQENGIFTFYLPDQSPILLIIWNKQEEKITYTYLRDSIHQTLERETEHDYKEYSLYQGLDTSLIQMDEDLTGKIRSYKYFNDYRWHCWNNTLENVMCDDDWDDKL